MWNLWDDAARRWGDAYAKAYDACSELRGTCHHQVFGWAALICGRVAAYRHDVATAEAFLAEALGRFFIAGDSYGTVLAEAHLAISQLSAGNVDRALKLSLRPWASGLDFEP